ncbi:MAG: hypothetical protein F6K31_30225 [Symploca sp. SIO2G7]|nr:hypothetical protein [Symploca sp. SIO2G7]
MQNDADKTFGWSFLGFWVGLVIGLISLWLSVFYQRQPRLSVAILSRTPVLSLQDLQNLKDNLEILYNKTNILESKQNLYVITLRFANIGRANIVKGDFDAAAPLGIQLVDVKNSRSPAEISIIQKPEVLDASSNYFSKLVVKIESNATVVIEPIILDAQQFFTIKLVALMPESFQPTVRVLGKIAGIREIELVDELSSLSANFFWQRWLLMGGIIIAAVSLGYLLISSLISLL